MKGQHNHNWQTISHVTFIEKDGLDFPLQKFIEVCNCGVYRYGVFHHVDSKKLNNTSN